MIDLAYASAGDDESAPVRGLRDVAIVVAVMVGLASFYTVWTDGIRFRDGRQWAVFIRLGDLITVASSLASATFVFAQLRGWRLSPRAPLAPLVWMGVCVVSPLGDLLFLAIDRLDWMLLHNLPRVRPEGIGGLIAILLRECGMIVVPIVVYRLLCRRRIGTALLRVFVVLGALGTIGLMVELADPAFLQFVFRADLTSRRMPAGYAAVIIIETWAARGQYVAMALVIAGTIACLVGAPSLLLRIGLFATLGFLTIHRGTEMVARTWELVSGAPLWGVARITVDDWLRTVALSCGIIAQRGGWAVVLLLLLRSTDQTRFVFRRSQSSISASDKSPAASER